MCGARKGDLAEQALDLRISIVLPYDLHFGKEKLANVYHFLESVIKLTHSRNLHHVVNL